MGRRKSYDEDEILAHAAAGLTAEQIVETMGLSITPRYVRSIVSHHFGSMPRLKELREKDDWPRELLARLMVEAGADPRCCHECGRWTTRPMAIRATCREPDVKDLVFVCVTRCATVADV